MNTAPNHVHPIAKNFADFLGLLLSCGDTAALEQAWMWNKEQFETFLYENPISHEQSQVLSMIKDKLNLKAMERPWEYIKNIQSDFDYSKIKYTEDYYDIDMNPEVKPAMPEWKVYFEGSFWGHQGRDHAGKEIRIDKSFKWAEKEWYIPAVYSCSKGLVTDICMKVKASEIYDFINKWNLSVTDSYDKFTTEQQLEMQRDNPLCFPLSTEINLNGHILKPSHGCSVSFNPCFSGDNSNSFEVNYITNYYQLDISYGWVILRSFYPWKTKRRPKIENLAITMGTEPERIIGPRLNVHEPGDIFNFNSPTDKIEYTLTVQKLEQHELPEGTLDSGEYIFPNHFTSISYTISPKLTDKIVISDCNDGDKPRKAMNNNHMFTPEESIGIGIIGGADGPVQVICGQKDNVESHTAYSAMYYNKEDTAHIKWRIDFMVKRAEDMTFTILDKKIRYREF